MEPYADSSGMMADGPPPSLGAGVLARISALNAQIAEQDALAPAAAMHARAWETRAAGLYHCGQRGDHEAIANLLTALQDEHPLVRATAVYVLGQMGARAPLAPLTEALRDPGAEVRERAVLALAGRVEPAVSALLAVAQHDDDADVRAAAALAMEQRCQVAIPGAAKYTFMRHAWQVLTWQWALLPRQWLVAIGLLFLGYVGALVLLPGHGRAHLHDIALLLGIVTTTASAIEIAFATNLRMDVGAELLLTTPTSPRLVILSRFALLMGINTLCSLAMSACVAVLQGQGLWGIVQVWFGPWLFIASLTLALTVVVGTSLALMAAGTLALAQTLRIDAAGAVLLHPTSMLWQSNPLLIVLAVVCVLWALASTPRRAWSEIHLAS